MSEQNSEMPAGDMSMQNEAVSQSVSEDTGMISCDEPGQTMGDEMKAMPEMSSDFPGMEEMYSIPDEGSGMSATEVSSMMPDGQMMVSEGTGRDMMPGELMSMTSAGNTVNLPGTWKLSLTQVLH